MSSNNSFKRVSFSPFSPEEIRKISVKQISVPNLDVDPNSIEFNSTLYSSLMSPPDQNMTCGTCDMNSVLCQGHFGHIQFPKRKSVQYRHRFVTELIDTSGGYQKQVNRPVVADDKEENQQIYLFHPYYYDTIIDILNCICLDCGALLIEKTNLPKYFKGRERLRKLVRTKDKECNNVYTTPDGKTITCEKVNPVCKADKSRYTISFSLEKKSRDTAKKDALIVASYEAYEVREMLKRIENCVPLGFAPGLRPENMIIENLLVIPPSLRPARYGGGKSHNDLTNIYSDIIKKCKAIEQSPKEEEDEKIKELHIHVSNLMDNTKGQHKYMHSRAFKTFKEIMKTKAGLIRGYIMGKRVNFCARTVASPNPNLRLNQVGIPENLARNVTIPERVTPSNIERLQRYLQQGRVDNVVKDSKSDKGKIAYLVDTNKSMRLEVGDIVNRWVMGAKEKLDGEPINEQRKSELLKSIKGDLVLVNRQPTLHKMSMMGMEVVIVPENTIQLSVNICAPFGADFDGDELNVHIPQSEAEIEELGSTMFVDECIVSAQANKPVVGVNQDALTALFLMTQKNVYVSKTNFNNIVLNTFRDYVERGLSSEFDKKIDSLFERIAKHPDETKEKMIASAKSEYMDSIKQDNDKMSYIKSEAARRGKTLEDHVESIVRDLYYVTGKELFSVILPDNYFYTKKNNKGVLTIVQDGILTEGYLDKGIAGSAHNSIVQDLYKMYSPQYAEDFITRAKWLADPWLHTSGFNISYEHCLTLEKQGEGPFYEEKIKPAIQKAREEAMALGPRLTNPLREIKRTQALANILNGVRNKMARQAVERIDVSNPFNAMVVSGSKGSSSNIASILSNVGQQESGGKPPKPIEAGTTVPAFEKYSTEPEAQAYISRNYLEGITPTNYFMLQLSSREGLFGTALKTPETGYIQRKLGKFLEDAIVYPDKTVRLHNGRVLQYNYGEDNMNGQKLVLTDGKPRFINIKRLVNFVKENRKSTGTTPFVKSKRPEPKYIMPLFEIEEIKPKPKSKKLSNITEDSDEDIDEDKNIQEGEENNENEEKNEDEEDEEDEEDDEEEEEMDEEEDEDDNY